MTRLLLGISVVVWFGYGAFCFLQPGFLGEVAGVTATSATGTVELRAMYGGLQMAIGVLAALGLMRAPLERPVLLVLGVLCAGLGSARTVAAMSLGDASGYNGGAAAFELATAALVAWLLTRKSPERASA
jgi:hypothetical protein